MSGVPAGGGPESQPAPAGGAPARRTLRERAPVLIRHYVPILTWLPAYHRDDLRPDVVAGLTSWGVMVPVALAYAGLAGVPPELGLATAFAALAAYAVFGTSRHVKVTVSSTMAITSASIVADVASGDPVLFAAETAMLAIIVGLILFAGGIARLGFISDFLSKAVITGFIFGVAITIVVGQVPKILGIPSTSGSVPEQVQGILSGLGETDPTTLAVGLTALVIIFGLRAISPRIPGALVVLVVGILAAKALDLAGQGVSLVGPIETGIGRPGIPEVPLDALPGLLLGAVGLVFLAVGETVGVGRSFGDRHRYEIDPDQELVALGAANVSSGLFGGFAVDASLSQTSTAEAAGTRTQLSSLVTSLLILATALVLAPIFTDLPNAVLGAIVIAAALGLMDWREMRRYWRWRRTDFVVATAALAGVVAFGVLPGLLVAVILSVSFLLYRASRPYVATIGVLPGQPRTFGDLARHPQALYVPGLAIVRVDAPLYFFNANVAHTQILRLVDAPDPRPRAVVVDLAATADLDVTTADMIASLLRDMGERTMILAFAQVRGPVRDRMRRVGLMDAIGEDRIYASLGTAVDGLARELALEGADEHGSGAGSGA
ncbi:MAG: sulfate permease [Chloroflexi bacterium]|jgi:high affinity sulfate transporter 1|nr:sulfate permease [Chloroflexota bacterium]